MKQLEDFFCRKYVLTFHINYVTLSWSVAEFFWFGSKCIWNNSIKIYWLSTYRNTYSWPLLHREVFSGFSRLSKLQILTGAGLFMQFFQNRKVWKVQTKNNKQNTQCFGGFIPSTPSDWCLRNARLWALNCKKQNWLIWARIGKFQSHFRQFSSLSRFSRWVDGTQITSCLFIFRGDHRIY